MTQTETDSLTQRSDLWLPRVGEAWMDWEFEVSWYKLWHIEWVDNKVLYSSGNYIQYPGMNHNWEEYEKECVCLYNWITLLYTWDYTVNQLCFQKKKKKATEIAGHCVIRVLRTTTGWQSKAEILQIWLSPRPPLPSSPGLQKPWSRQELFSP